MTIFERTLVAALLALVVSLILTRLIQWLAVRHDVLDRPNDRSSHVTPVPRLGGIAIVVAFLVGFGVITRTVTDDMLAILAGGVLMAVSGFYDDVRPIRAWMKYVPQIAAAVLVVLVLRPQLYVDFPFIDAYLRGWVPLVLAVLWITAVTNAFNFMDGLDGLAAGCGAIASIAIVVIADGAPTVILVPLAMALVGFLMWNTHPAMIFMGDTGSQFTGFVLSAAILLRNDRYVDIIPAIVVLVPLLFDTGFTLIRRWRSGENVFSAHRSHLYQRVNIVGIDQRTVANFYYIAIGFCGAIAVAYAEVNDWGQLALIAIGGAMLAVYAHGVGLLESRAGIAESVVRAPSMRQRHAQSEKAGNPS